MLGWLVSLLSLSLSLCPSTVVIILFTFLLGGSVLVSYYYSRMWKRRDRLQSCKHIDKIEGHNYFKTLWTVSEEV
jgi:hypothetical protein